MAPSLIERVLDLHERTAGRTIVGVAGPPGSGKTTLVQTLIAELERMTPGISAWVPMDGFHLADSTLRRLGRFEAKGAIDTFDGRGYLTTLRRARLETSTTVYAPEFDRLLEQPIAAGMAVDPGVEIIFTEGNYLLDAEEPWPSVHDELDEVWFCDVAADVRTSRLVARHVEFGKSPAAAADWVALVDEPNAQRIAAGRSRADLFVSTETPFSPLEPIVNP